MEVFLASGNAHKFEEFAEMIYKDRLPVKLHLANDIGGMPEVEETGTTFEANARIKGEALLDKLPEGAWALADDSGLEVDALDGAPGVQSARYAGPAGNAAANNIKLLQALRGVPMKNRTARFVCVLFFANSGGEDYCFRGSCEGHILETPSGKGGFGYDPLFQPLGYNKSFAALGSAVKHGLSHRGRALKEWMQFVRRLAG
ncbi:MAG: RdgB/HAM1 family non-canonical purine NTP pyrophosphatase [Oceanipulchritudo sp.]